MRRYPAVVNRLESGHDAEYADCAIVALSVYLGIAYTDVIRVAARVVEDGGRQGLQLAAIRRIAELFDAPLDMRQDFDIDEDYGIVWLDFHRRKMAHCAVLRNGMVIDRLGLWEWSDWIADQLKPSGSRKKPLTVEVCSLLVVKE